MNHITCPKCGEKIEISEALTHEIRDEVKKSEALKYKEELEKEKQKLSSDLEQKIKKESQKELERFEKEKQLLEEKLKKEQKEREEFEKYTKENSTKEAEKEFLLKLKEKDKQLEDAREAARKANDELKRKLNQGSQQLQGEVLELSLQERLNKTFQYDEITPVPKGINGADIIQEIRNKFGNVAGSIIWETKRSKAWNKNWLTKLKDDMRKVNASEAIIVTDILPPDIELYDRIDGVWVVSYENAIQLAYVLRIGILNLAIVKSTASQGDEKLRDLYKIITSDSFRHKFEQRNEIIDTLRKELTTEIASTERRWKRQEETIRKLASNNNQLYGELQAHIPSLKPLKGDSLELESGESDNEQESFI